MYVYIIIIWFLCARRVQLCFLWWLIILETWIYLEQNLCFAAALMIFVPTITIFFLYHLIIPIYWAFVSQSPHHTRSLVESAPVILFVQARVNRIREIR